MVAWLPAIIALVLFDSAPSSYYVFLASVYPLQGLFNALVYFRPKYVAERHRMFSSSEGRGSQISTIFFTLKIPRPKRPSIDSIARRASLDSFLRQPTKANNLGSKSKRLEGDYTPKKEECEEADDNLDSDEYPFGMPLESDDDLERNEYGKFVKHLNYEFDQEGKEEIINSEKNIPHNKETNCEAKVSTRFRPDLEFEHLGR